MRVHFASSNVDRRIYFTEKIGDFFINIWMQSFFLSVNHGASICLFTAIAWWDFYTIIRQR